MATRGKRLLSDKEIRNAKPKDSPYRLRDGDALFAVVYPSGEKSWLMRPKFKGAEIPLVLGRYPDISLFEARRLCDEVHSQIRAGIDPRQAKKDAERQNEAQKDNTFEKVARRLYESKKGKTTDDYRNRMLRQLEIHMFPVIGKKTMQEITGRELLELFQTTARKLSKTGKPMTYMAKKLCSWTGEVYGLFNVETGFTVPNPCGEITKILPKHVGQNARQVKQDLIGDFVRALESYGGHFYTKAAMWMMLYTGFRTASIRRAKWKDIDLKKKVWNRIPEKRDKNIHVVPLPRQAVALLRKLKDMTGGDADGYVFPSGYFYRPKQMSENDVTQAVNRMGFDATGHGLMGTVQTALNEMGYDPRMVEIQVGHSIKNPVEAAYNKAKLFEPRKKMMQEWADKLDTYKEVQ